MRNRLKDRKFNVSLSVRTIMVVALVLTIIAATTVSAVHSSKRVVTISDGQNPQIQVKTYKSDVGGVLTENNIVLGKYDKLSVEKDSQVSDNMTIEIYRAIPVTVTASGKTEQYYTTRRVVGEVLKELGFNATPTDITTPGFNDTIEKNASISYKAINTKKMAVIEEIPYASEERVNRNLKEGTKKVVQKGKTGTKNVQYAVHYENGNEVSKETVTETVIEDAVTEITEIAPKRRIDYYQIASAGSIQTSRSGELSYNQVISCVATGYHASTCGKSAGAKGYGITATGSRAQKGVVAVDPRVIPLGTRLYIESGNGYVYGYAVAGDTGGAIKGNRVDLCFDTYNEALSFGRQSVKVYVLN